MNVKQDSIVLLSCLATQIAMGEPSLAEKNAAENAPFQPFRLIGNIHYVGASGISSFLIADLHFLCPHHRRNLRNDHEISPYRFRRAPPLANFEAGCVGGLFNRTVHS